MGTERIGSPTLEAFIDKSIELSKARGYNPVIFTRMRRQRGTIEAIERLVLSGDIQSGFKRLQQLNLLEWTIEAAVTKFPGEFGPHAQKCAEWRLAQVTKPSE
ncbi:hypothetical protein [Nitrobacter sp.]|jgi:hypothetical protein|uniref:hypothetical protein n=1 Tax=Nitrobacter sp. TaxID=29420 RepID=UPI003F654828